jgi:predicted ATPase
VRPYFARLLGLPLGDSDIAGLEPEAFRRGLHEAFAAWLTALADEAPVVVALEDFHWADASSVALTADLVSSTAERPVLLYLIARPEAEQLLDELAPQRAAIRLAQLSEEGIEALTESVLDGLPPRDLIPFIVRRTAGNPFFVEELLHSLKDSEAGLGRPQLADNDRGSPLGAHRPASETRGNAPPDRLGDRAPRAA